jgi:voltage-gated potassium channel Kch
LNYLKYHFDRILAKGTGALLVVLAIFTLLSLALLSFLILWAQRIDGLEGESDYGETYWLALNTAIDPSGVDDPGWAYRLALLVVALFGLTVVGTLIGILSNGISSKLEAMRRGKSRVIEKNHTLILGWSRKVTDAIKELIEANRSQRRGVIVILADMDKVEMEDHLKLHIPERGSTEIICRCGDPSDVVDLALVQPSKARSILIFAENGYMNDAVTLKRAMAVKKRFEATGFQQPIIAEIADENVVNAARAIGGVEIVQPRNIIMRIIVQAARQPGLSMVYSEILSFSGSEIYIIDGKPFAGMSYGESVLSMENSSVMGICLSNGTHILNPDPERLLEEGDQLIVIASDDSDVGSFKAVTRYIPGSGEFSLKKATETSNKFIIFGWNDGGHILMSELNDCLPPGTQITICRDTSYCAKAGVEEERYPNLIIDLKEVKAGCKEDLDRLDLDNVDEFIIIGYRDCIPPQKADSISLITLIHLRALLNKSENKFRIATELLDTNNRVLAASQFEEDFIASEELISNLMAQLSENPRLSPILAELMTSEGCEFYLRPITYFDVTEGAIVYRDLVHQGLRFGETVVGYMAKDPSVGVSKLQLAPEKSRLVDSSNVEAIVVIAE